MSTMLLIIDKLIKGGTSNKLSPMISYFSYLVLHIASCCSVAMDTDYIISILSAIGMKGQVVALPGHHGDISVT